MDSVAGLIATITPIVIDLAIKGANYLVELNKAQQRQLQALRNEVTHNITALRLSGYDKNSGLKITAPEFITLAGNLDAAITGQLFQDKAAIKTALKTAKRKKTKKTISYTAYALDYTVKQIDSLKQLAHNKPGSKPPDIRLKRRLDTLTKHLTFLGKVLSAIPVTLPPPQKQRIK